MFVFRCAEKVSSSFAEAASSRKDGETTFDAKLGDLEQHLKTAEKQLLQSQVSRIAGREEYRCRDYAHMYIMYLGDSASICWFLPCGVHNRSL